MIHDITVINQMVKKGDIGDYIAYAEHAFDHRIWDIACDLRANRHKTPIVLIAGPSSSGKTTFCRKLADTLNRMGIHAESISLDDFYLPREKSPRKKDGSYDFETVNALDLPELQRCFEELVKTGKSQMPMFSFRLGRPKEERKQVVMDKDTIVLVEGMHALSDKVAKHMPGGSTFRIYISLLGDLFYGQESLIDKRNLRILRRLVRDDKFRGASAEHTLQLWLDVIAGDILYVEPFESRADIKVNSFFPHEAGILKPFAVPLLQQIPEDSLFYDQCRSILEKLEKVEAIPLELLPGTSLIREFVGDSVYYT